MLELTDITKLLIALLAITNPIGAIPIFLSLTAENTPKERTKIALTAGLAIAIIMVVVTWAGAYILNAFGIGIYSFKVAGGIILLLMGISMLRSEAVRIKHSKKDNKAAEEKDSVAVVPLALPLIAGPGTISTLIIASQSYSGVTNGLIISGVSLAIAIVLTIVLLSATLFSKVLGQSGINITSKVMGMMLTALAVEMMASGAVGLFPALM